MDGGGNPHIGHNDVYLYIGSNRLVRSRSSSGGVFTAFSREILDAGGIVYASRYDFSSERLEVADTDRYPLDEFRKSKYIESNTRHSFSEIRSWLSKRRKVLFCGTPCQIAGLKTYLGKNEHPDLFTIDFFCHGVPSNVHFTEYKHFLEGPQRRMTGFDFRYKSHEDGTGWHDLLFKADFDDGTSIIQPYRAPYYYKYYRPFEESLILRRSCYQCCAVNCSRADVTIGDFWGISRFAPQLDDNGGISAVKLHSLHAKELWPRIAATGTVQEIPFATIEMNYTPKYPLNLLIRRNRLAVRISEKGFLPTMERYYRREYVIYKIKTWIKKWLNRSE